MAKIVILFKHSIPEFKAKKTAHVQPNSEARTKVNQLCRDFV
jgi:hypothetical protein